MKSKKSKFEVFDGVAKNDRKEIEEKLLNINKKLKQIFK